MLKSSNVLKPSSVYPRSNDVTNPYIFVDTSLEPSDDDTRDSESRLLRIDHGNSTMTLLPPLL